jgi:hypothetical protein
MWVPQPVWTRSKSLPPAGICSLDCPALSESLYLLSYVKLRKEAVINYENISILREDLSLYPEVILCKDLIRNKVETYHMIYITVADLLCPVGRIF